MKIDINKLRERLKNGILSMEANGKNRREIADVTGLNLNAIDRILHKGQYPKIEGLLSALELIKA